MKLKIPEIRLNDGNSMPALGLGTWQLKGERCKLAVRAALKLGYTLIDTAEMYWNQGDIRKAIQGLERKKLFITSKAWMANLRRSKLLNACRKTLKSLGTGYLDLYLIHWPSKSVPISETLRAMDELKKQGKIRSIGVSNFTIQHLEEALETGVRFSNNQVEFHPGLYQKELLDFCRKKKISVTAYSPLARGDVCQEPTIQEIARGYGKTEAQVSLRWLLQKGAAVIPKAGSPQHLKDNMGVFGWKLKKQDEKALDDLGNGNRKVNPFFADFGDTPSPTQRIFRAVRR